MQLDLQTLTIGSVITTTLSALFFVVIWQLNRRVEGIKVWLLAVSLQPLAWLAIALRGQAPDFVSIVLGNYLLLASLFIFYFGIRIFFHNTQRVKRYLLIFSALFLPCLTYFTYLEPNILVRVYLVYFVAFVTIALSIKFLLALPKKQQSKGTHIYIGMCSLIAILIIIRLLSSIPLDIDMHLYNTNFSNFIGTIIGFVVPQSLALAVFIFAFERREQKIRQLSAQAKQESALKTRYLATLSHELRTPVNGMMGIAQVILGKLKHKNYAQAEANTIPLLNTIITSGQQVVELADSILEYALLERQNQLTLNKSKIEVADFLNGINQLVMPLAQQKQLHLTITLSHDVPKFITIDATKLRAILLNLINNGIKYTEKGSVRLNVDIERTQGQAIQSLQFSVVDTGIGMHDSSFEQLSQPFMRGKKQTTKEHGAGLGLFIVKTMLQTLKGCIEYSPNQPMGSIVSITVPFSSAITTESFTKNKEHNVITTNSNALTVLLIEDILLNIEVVKALSMQQGHKVTTAQTGQTAKRILREQKFDCILLDIQLPDVVGLGLYHYITANVPKTPIILLTAAVTKNDLELYQTLNISALVEKPIIKEKLLAALSRNTALSLAKTKNYPDPFSAATFKLLETTLPKQLLTEKIQQLPLELSKNIQQIQKYNFAGEQDSISQLCHKASSYFGQFGLLQVRDEIAKINVLSAITAADLDKPIQTLKQGLPLLKQYWQDINAKN